MKSTGIVKHVDKLGRIKIPKELRTSLNITCQSSLSLTLQSRKQIMLSKMEDRCIFCNSRKNIHYFKDKVICKNCLIAISKIHS